MSARFELMTAGVVAVLAHGALLGLLAPFGADGGGGGSDGRSVVSFSSGSAELAALVEIWEAVPNTSDAIADLVAPGVDSGLSAPDTWQDAALTTEIPALPSAPDIQAAPEISAPEIAALPSVSPPIAETNPKIARLGSPAQPPKSAIEAAVPSMDATPLIDDAPEPPELALKSAPRPPVRPDAPATVARDVGDAQTSGNGAASNARVGAGNARSLEAAWASAIQSRIARFQSYPRGARGAGRVRLQMVILPNGHLSEVSVAQSSGVRAFDLAALKAAKRAAPFPPAPAALEDEWYRVAQWVNFSR